MSHLRACEKWKDRDRRDKTDSNVEQLVVFIVIKTLVAKGQSIRGHTEETDFRNEDVSGGLFLKH